MWLGRMAIRVSPQSSNNIRPGVGPESSVEPRSDTTSVGLFLDIGGDDTYFGKPQSGTTWLDPPDSVNWKVRNFSVGVDRAAGRVDLTPVPERAPTGVRR